jgi:2,4-dienoyl-CoA reductase-like NADH-dependent reductase (Old Yellow Enzyme family)
LVRFLKQEGALAATQITHSGRKGSTPRSFDKPGELGPADAGWQRWEVVGPSALPAGEGYAMPKQLTEAELDELVVKFGEAARRADACGYDIVEIHGAHGYLLAQFLSPISNTRNDQYGGDRAGRMRFPLAAARAVRQNWPERKPMFIRVSAVDGAGGWDVDDTIAYARELKALGIDVIDTSSGGLTGLSTALPVKRTLGFQVPFAAAIKRQANIPTMTVGLILDGPAGGEDPAGRRRRPDRDRPAGALRSILALHASQELGCDPSFDYGLRNTAGGSTSAGTICRSNEARQDRHGKRT